MTVDEKKRDPPTWLNNDFVQKLLQTNWSEPNLALTSCLINPAVAVGDNYASLIYRITLVLKRKPAAREEKLSLVCKVLASSEMMQELSQSVSIFEKEADGLMKIMPKINRLLMTTLKGQEPLCAECCAYGTKPGEYLVLQDLKELGFALADRINGLDWETTKLVLSGHAKLHAGSLALQQREPSVFDNFKVNVWADTTTSHVEGLVTSSLKNVIRAASTWPEFPKAYLDRIKAVEGSVMQKMHDALVYDENSLNVYQHGDSWISNMMFTKGEDGKYNSLRFVDFQCSCLCSAAMDLNYFLFTSPKVELRVSKIDDALEHYHQQFTHAINKLGVVLPRKFTLDELKSEFLRRNFFGFIALIAVYPITITEAKDVLDVNSLFTDGDEKLAMYQNAIFKKTFMTVMPYFIENGTL